MAPFNDQLINFLLDLAMHNYDNKHQYENAYPKAACAGAEICLYDFPPDISACAKGGDGK